jgi:hypothetical protein
MKRKIAFILILLTVLLTFALILGQAGAAGAYDATATPTFGIGFGCTKGCTPIPPWPVMPTSAPTPAPVRERVFLPVVIR